MSTETVPHCKVLGIEDFADPELRELIRDAFAPELDRIGPDFPDGVEHRKHWEVAMAIRALRAAGAVHPEAEVLGVAAGFEFTIYWLTREVRRVFATDLYLDSGVWHEIANESMLVDPGRFYSGEWDPRRLVVQHMDALELRYPDESFDAVFSSSSIEHFGSHENVRRALAEMHRVLKPGGLLSISTEFRLDGPSPGAPDCLMFDAGELEATMLDGFGWEPLDEFDPRISANTLAVALTPDQVFARTASGSPVEWLEVPHLVLRHEDWLWTSCHLALKKS
jgi:SAM-dependent methyltransferase